MANKPDDFIFVDFDNSKDSSSGGISKEIALSYDSTGIGDSLQGAYSEGLNLDPGVSILDNLRNSVTPKKKKNIIKAALDWRSKCDLLSGLVNLKRDFSIIGLNIVSKPNEASSDVDAEFQNRLNSIKQKWNFSGLIETLIDDYFTTDSMILYWRVPGDSASDTRDSSVSSSDSIPSAYIGEKHRLIPGLIYIAALSPNDVDWDNSFGRDILIVKIPIEIINKIKIVLAIRDKEEKERKLTALIDDGIPEKYIIAVIKGKDEVALDKRDGDNWVVKTKGRDHHGLAYPSMKPIFLSLSIRHSLKEGDFGAAYRMKHFIFHATCGESIEGGPAAGTKNNWATLKETTALLDLLKGIDKTTLAATNHTVKFSFIFPPSEMFDGIKYKKHESIIYDWAGVSIVMYTGEGGKYASGFIGIKRMVAHMIKAREDVSWLFNEFFDHETIRGRIGTPDNSDVSISFDENVLKEPKQLLDELKFMFQEGFGDPRIATKELGRDPDIIRRSKISTRKDNEETQAYEPIYVQAFGGFGNDRGDGYGSQSNPGRPLNSGSESTEDTRTQRPRAEE